MSKEKKQVEPSENKIIKKIILLRNEKVLLDVHLAELYGVETRALKQAVRRNMERFPADFMFELSPAEIDRVVSQNVIPHKKNLGGATPFAFTETGVAMLSGVLKGKIAVEMNIAIMRTFVALRKASANYKEMMELISSMRNEYDEKFTVLFNVLDKVVYPPLPKRNKIGFIRDKEEE